MKKLLCLSIAVLFLAILPNWAMAVTFSPTAYQLDDFVQIWTNTTINYLGVNPIPWPDGGTGAHYSVNFRPLIDSSIAEQIRIGKNDSWNLTGFSEYSLYIQNTNENIWDYNLYVQDGSYHESQWISLLNGSSQTFTLDLSTINLSSVNSLGFNIRGNVPIHGYDVTSETNVSPVPEPSSMMLLGMGVLGLLGFRRKIS